MKKNVKKITVGDLLENMDLGCTVSDGKIKVIVPDEKFVAFDAEKTYNSVNELLEAMKEDWENYFSEGEMGLVELADFLDIDFSDLRSLYDNLDRYSSKCCEYPDMEVLFYVTHPEYVTKE